MQGRTYFGAGLSTNFLVLTRQDDLSRARLERIAVAGEPLPCPPGTPETPASDGVFPAQWLRSAAFRTYAAICVSSATAGRVRVSPRTLPAALGSRRASSQTRSVLTS